MISSRRFLVGAKALTVWSYDDPARPAPFALDPSVVRDLVSEADSIRRFLSSRGLPGADPASISSSPPPKNFALAFLSKASALLPRSKVAHALAMISHTEDGVVLHYEDGFHTLLNNSPREEKLIGLIHVIEQLPLPAPLVADYSDKTPADSAVEVALPSPPPPSLSSPHPLSLPVEVSDDSRDPPTKANQNILADYEPPETASSAMPGSFFEHLQSSRSDVLVGPVFVVAGLSTGRPQLGTDFDGTPMPVSVAPAHFIPVLRGLKTGSIKAGAFSFSEGDGSIVLSETFEGGKWISRTTPPPLSRRNTRKKNIGTTQTKSSSRVPPEVEPVHDVLPPLPEDSDIPIPSYDEPSADEHTLG